MSSQIKIYRYVCMYADSASRFIDYLNNIILMEIIPVATVV